jgi:RHS repeat-associated protein
MLPSKHIKSGQSPSCSTTSGNTYEFTGKERHSESGLDDFGARYYSSQYGRFMIPDWAAKATAVPYADFGNPQTLNLYAIERNNPREPNRPRWSPRMQLSLAKTQSALKNAIRPIMRQQSIEYQPNRNLLNSLSVEPFALYSLSVLSIL